MMEPTRETIIALKATKTAFRVATDIAAPHIQRPSSPSANRTCLCCGARFTDSANSRESWAGTRRIVKQLFETIDEFRDGRESLRDVRIGVHGTTGSIGTCDDCVEKLNRLLVALEMVEKVQCEITRRDEALAVMKEIRTFLHPVFVRPEAD